MTILSACYKGESHDDHMDACLNHSSQHTLVSPSLPTWTDFSLLR